MTGRLWYAWRRRRAVKVLLDLEREREARRISDREHGWLFIILILTIMFVMCVAAVGGEG